MTKFIKLTQPKTIAIVNVEKVVYADPYAPSAANVTWAKTYVKTTDGGGVYTDETVEQVWEKLDAATNDN